MPIVPVADIDMHYETFGNGPPLILVSGLGGNASYWQPNIAALSQNHTVIIYDHRGIGQSTRHEGAYSVELLASDLIGLMDALGIAKAAIIGHSTGGAIGQIIAAQTPGRVERLMLYASWAVLCPQMAQCLLLRQSALRAIGVEAYHRASPVFLYPPHHTNAHWPRIEQEISAATAASSSATILDARLEAIMRFDGLTYLDRITTPTTILVAQDDILTPPASSDLLARHIAGATLRHLPHGGHAVSRTDPAAFAAECQAFLA